MLGTVKVVNTRPSFVVSEIRWSELPLKIFQRNSFVKIVQKSHLVDIQHSMLDSVRYHQKCASASLACFFQATGISCSVKIAFLPV